MTNNTGENNKNTKNEPQNPYLKNAKRSIEDQSSFVRTLNIMLIVFVGILLSIFILADNKDFLEDKFGNDSLITKLFVSLAKSKSKKEHAEFALPFGLKRQNILFLGVDANNSGSEKDRWSNTRSDTIIVVNIDPKTKSINAISVPRDSKVYLPNNKGVNKINAAHALGGVRMTKETIEDTLGIRIDRYIIVHDDAVRKIVEALDGIDLYVEKNMYYNDYAGKLHINLKKGENHLTANEAVGYLRFRHDATGDIGRTQRQQWFMRALITKLQEPQTITKIPDIVSVAKKYVKTDMSLYEMSQYAALMKQIDLDKIEIATLPGAPNKRGYISYWILDPEKTQETINRLIYRDKVSINDANHFAASVMYSSENKENAEKLIDNLKTAGIEVKCTGSANKMHTQFISHSNKVTNEYYNWLKKKAPGFSGIQFVYDPANYYCAETDFTIILSGK